jgi:hypothetical protein
MNSNLSTLQFHSPTVPSDSLKDYLQYLQHFNPPVVQAWAADSERDFIESVESALENSIRRIEGMARDFCHSSERQLSLMLSQFMDAGGMPTTAETNHNGHADLSIQHPAGKFGVVLGECKIYAGYQRRCKGCDQLLNRYSSGRSPRGFCLDFFEKPAMYEKMNEVRNEFDTHRPLRQTKPSSDHRIKGCFLTIHLHFTATEIEVLHLCCNVFHPDS